MLDADLLDFIRTSIRSTWALELLLEMRKQSGRDLAGSELVRTLRASPTLVSSCLKQLRTAGLVVPVNADTWRYAPAAPALHNLVDKLEHAYAERPVAVINTILSARNADLRSFSDAFRLPKKDD